MKVISNEQYEFYKAARVAFRYTGEPDEAERLAEAERAWRKMVLNEVKDRVSE